MNYTHIGLEDQAQALAGLPAPFASVVPDGLHYGCNPGGAPGRVLSPDDTVAGGDAGPRNKQSPAGGGLRRWLSQTFTS
jgi:hypothetical protein